MNKLEKWTRAVMERDSWTCQDCGTTLHLDAAHIIPRRVRPDLRFNVSNGVTLCRAHHDFYHAYPKLFTCFVERWQSDPVRPADRT